MEHIGLIIGWLSAFVGFFTTLYQFRRVKRAEVGSKEVATADQMIELVKKAFEEALELNKKENEKLKKVVAKLERALREIGRCTHNDNCPVTSELRDGANGGGKYQQGGNR